MTKQELLNGEKFFFNNELHQIEIEDDDIRQAKVWHDGNDSCLPSWGHGFKIFFNGKLIHSSKTFKSLEKRLNKLINDWHLIESEEL